MNQISFISSSQKDVLVKDEQTDTIPSSTTLEGNQERESFVVFK